MLSIIIVGYSSSILAAPKAKMIGFWNDSEATSQLSIDNSKWQAILSKYVDDNHSSGVNRFNYAQVTESDKQLLIDYLNYMQQMDPRQLNPSNQKAFWLNLYNATVVSAILAKDASSIKSLNNVWKKKRLEVTRQPMSLDDIEHGVIRPLYNDPRIHFAITPATIGSGDILATPYTGDNVEQLLEENTKRFFNNSNKGVYIEGNKLVVSSIFKWYKSDFGGSNDGIKVFIKRYVDEDMKLKIDQIKKISYQYNWELNKP